jgi:hypothetical protein
MLLAFDLFAQFPDSEIRDLKGGRVADDTSYIYWLPFEVGKNIFLYKVGKASICTKTSNHSILR